MTRKIRPYKHRNPPVRYSEDPRFYRRWYYHNVLKPKLKQKREKEKEDGKE